MRFLMARRKRGIWAGRGAFVCLLAVAAGCSDPGYAFYAVTGQLGLMARARPIDQVLADGMLTEAQKAKVQELLAIRDYAAKALRLRVGDSYTTYVDTGDEPVAFNLSASFKDSLTPVTWEFPFVGRTPYLGFFDRQEALDYQSRLVSKGYDTLVYSVEAYSTLGLFPDPITTSMLSRTESYLADLLFHECTHNTVWRDGDTDFDENAAVFLGRVGTLKYLAERYGDDSAVVIEAQRRYHDEDLYNAALSRLFEELTEFYASDRTSAEKIDGRAALFEETRRRFREEVQPQMFEPQGYDYLQTLNINNAWVLLNARYNNDLEVFEAAYEAVGRDYDRMLDLLLEAAASSDPIAFLRSAAD